MKLTSRIVLVLAMLPASLVSQAQQVEHTEPTFDAGLEIQAYPTGLIPGLTAELGFRERNAVHIRLGYNFFDHRDFGVHDDEDGGGPGFTLGYRRYFRDGGSGLWLGARADVWFNGVTWCDGCESSTVTTGTTELVVLQPTAEAGWLFAVADEKMRLGPSVGFGWEWNAVTKGEPTGEGAILLLGARLQYRVK